MDGIWIQTLVHSGFGFCWKTLWVFVVRCSDSDGVAVLILEDCALFLPICQRSWRGSCFGKSNAHIRGEAFSVCFVHCCRRAELCLQSEVIDLWPQPCFVCFPHGCIYSRVSIRNWFAAFPPTPPNMPAKLLPWSAVNNACGSNSGPKILPFDECWGAGEKKRWWISMSPV